MQIKLLEFIGILDDAFDGHTIKILKNDFFEKFKKRTKNANPLPFFSTLTVLYSAIIFVCTQLNGFERIH